MLLRGCVSALIAGWLARWWGGVCVQCLRQAAVERRAANQGHVLSQLQLGNIYYDGELPKDIVEDVKQSGSEHLTTLTVFARGVGAWTW